MIPLMSSIASSLASSFGQSASEQRRGKRVLKLVEDGDLVLRSPVTHVESNQAYRCARIENLLTNGTCYAADDASGFTAVSPLFIYTGPCMR